MKNLVIKSQTLLKILKDKKKNYIFSVFHEDVK